MFTCLPLLIMQKTNITTNTLKMFVRTNVQPRSTHFSDCLLCVVRCLGCHRTSERQHYTCIAAQKGQGCTPIVCFPESDDAADTCRS